MGVDRFELRDGAKVQRIGRVRRRAAAAIAVVAIVSGLTPAASISAAPSRQGTEQHVVQANALGLAIPCVTGLGAGGRAVERLAINNERAGNFATRVAEKIGARPLNAEAHHVFPVEFGDYFARNGIDINKADYGTWIDRTEHQGITGEFRKDWAAFVEEEHTTQEIIDFGRMLGGKYGFDVHF